MTDIIKNFEEKISGNVLKYLNTNPEVESRNVELFRQEISDLKCNDPLIIAFGDIVYEILIKNFGQQFKVKKVMHYSQRISKEKYRAKIWKTLLEKEPD